MASGPDDGAGGGHLDIRESPLVQGAAEAERPTRWWVGWLFAVGVGVLVANIAFGGIVSALLGSPALGSPVSQLSEVLTNGFTLVVIGLWVVRKERRPFTSLGFRGSQPVGRALVGFALGIAAFVVPTLVLVGVGQLGDGRSAHTRSGMDALALVALLLLTFVVQATAEEVVTRGYMLQVGGLQLPSWIAVVLSSFLFAAIHLDFHPLVLLNITLYAVAASFVALGQGSLWLVCGFHIAWNWVQGNVMGIAVSGTPREVALFTFGAKEGSSDLLTGGSFGLEGSLAASLVLALLAIGGFVYYRRCAARRATVTS